MNYLTGEIIKVGDEVLIEHERTIGTIFSVIEFAEDMQNWGVDEQGVIIAAEPFGLTMWSHKDKNDPLVFKNRKR